MQPRNKSIQIEIPHGTREDIVEEFKRNLLSVLSQGVYTKPQYIRPAEAANHLSISRPTIYKMMKTGILKSHKLMGSRLINVDDIRQLLSNDA